MTTSETTYLLDVNVLLALVSPDHVHAGRAHAWFEGVTAWATTPITEAGLLRLLLNPVVAGAKRPAVELTDLIRSLRSQPGWSFVPDASALAEPVIDLTGLQGHRQVTDVHLANLAALSGAVLATFDARIPAALMPEDRRHCFVVPA